MRIADQPEPSERTGAIGSPVSVEQAEAALVEHYRFGQHVLAGAHWKAKSGDWYLLAAGSRRITGIEATGGVRATADGPTMPVKAPEGADATLRAALAGGGTLAALR